MTISVCESHVLSITGGMLVKASKIDRARERYADITREHSDWVNGYTDEQVRMVERFISGERISVIAKDAGVTRSAMYQRLMGTTPKGKGSILSRIGRIGVPDNR